MHSAPARRARLRGALPAALLVSVGLAGCTAGPAPASPTRTAAAEQPTATATSTPSPTPARAEAEVAAVVITSSGITLESGDGATLAEFGYFDGEATAAVDALTDAFGSEPAVSIEEAVTHFPASVNSDWDGFELVDFDVDAEFPEQADFAVGVTTAEVGGVDITTADGAAVGMPVAEVEPLAYRDWIDDGGMEAIRIFLLDQLPVEADVHPDYEPAALSVSILVPLADERVERILAPGRNWGS